MIFEMRPEAECEDFGGKLSSSLDRLKPPLPMLLQRLLLAFVSVLLRARNRTSRRCNYECGQVGSFGFDGGEFLFRYFEADS